MSKLTDQQIQNFRNVLFGIIGPYAAIMPVAQIEAYRDKLQSNIDAMSTELKTGDSSAPYAKKNIIVKHDIDLHGVSAMGTTAEICSKYNLSKSAVRKMKADGTLEAFIEAQKNV